ncbi:MULTISPECIES: Mur ligase family protein [unclassified Wenzhouxiangella]|uniref:Mur ligase family protein n=1 Tax=unclassified Wenzhouxiangella TaxID=2613841 RepID=UPI000E3271FF|nr:MULTISPECIES: Mur ligase family protein [unclassified Wenzhouxiangella]RFF26244.1 hypothetical protein DZK25_13965 [Wenzhouxiangella sp. 15181]RFP68240.1 hypothetical protein DZK26_09055 [Wenzhouxiangella sp. 15190]
MFKLVGTRFRTGHSPYGPPPVARVELRTAVSPQRSTSLERLHHLSRQGLLEEAASASDGDSLDNESVSRWFGSLMARLLERGGHRAGRPQIETHAGEGDTFFVNLPCEEPDTVEKAAEVAGRFLFDASRDNHDDIADLEQFLDFAGARMPHPDTRRIIRVARACALPVLRLDQDPFESAPGPRPFYAGLIQIGQGVNRRVLAGAVPWLDQQKLMRVASREALVTHLRRHGLPLAPQVPDFPTKNRASRAVRAAERLGKPIAMRAIYRQPFAHARQSTALFEPLASERAITAAFQAASVDHRQVWVEAHVPGDRVRCLLIGGVLVAATRATPPTITGDGVRSVSELTAHAAACAESPRQRQAWKAIEAGDRDVQARLAIAGLTPTAIPEAGRHVSLRGEGTAFNGGTLENVLDRLSAPIRELAERAAAAFGLDEIAAVDLAVVDPAGEASAPNCHVLDVVPDPDLQSHIEGRPEAGDELPHRLLDALFPSGRPVRIPTVAITGTNGKTTTSRMTASILRGAYGVVGLTTTEGAYVGDDCVLAGDVAGVPGAALVLADDRTRAAVLETARGALQALGTAVEAVDAAACLNIAADHLGVDGITTLEELAAVKSRVLELADGYAAVNADNPQCLAMLSNHQRARPILVSRNPESADVADHLAAGHRAVLIDRADDGREYLWFAQGSTSDRLMPTHDIPAVMNGLLPFNTLNAAFAAALCWSLGVDNRLIREGLARFSNSVEDNAGRYNFIEGYPFTLLTDFAQNAHGLAELYSVIEKLPIEGKKRLVCLTIGSRHREHIEENVRDLADRFDSLIIGCSDYADENPQYAGSNPRETMLAHFRKELLDAGTHPERIETHAQPETAIRHGLEITQPGDLLVVLGNPKVVLAILEETAEP